MTVFGIQAIKRCGLERKDRFQIWRFVCLRGFQWLFFFLIPEFLFQWAVEYKWVGDLAQDPAFADQSWRSYGIVYAWPLFFYTFFYTPHHIGAGGAVDLRHHPRLRPLQRQALLLLDLRLRRPG